MVNQQLNTCPASTPTMKNPILWKKSQAFWIWVINNTQKYARCAHGSSNTPKGTKGKRQRKIARYYHKIATK